VKNDYLCNRYPENNLFTLKRLIPIEANALRCEARGIFVFPALENRKLCYLMPRSLSARAERSALRWCSL
jgi:hypothetical protein